MAFCSHWMHLPNGNHFVGYISTACLLNNVFSVTLSLARTSKLCFFLDSNLSSEKCIRAFSRFIIDSIQSGIYAPLHLMSSPRPLWRYKSAQNSTTPIIFCREFFSVFFPHFSTSTMRSSIFTGFLSDG
jgi:hypothetical protein